MIQVNVVITDDETNENTIVTAIGTQQGVELTITNAQRQDVMKMNWTESSVAKDLLALVHENYA